MDKNNDAIKVTLFNEHRSTLIVGLICGIIFFILGAGAVMIFQKGKAAGMNEKISRSVAGQQQAPNNPIAQSFIDKGVNACSERINQVTNFLGTGASTGAFLFIPPSQQDKSLVSASLEITGSDNNSAYSTVSFAPNQANGCEAIYDGVAWWPKKCAEVAAQQFQKLQSAGLLKQNITILDMGPTTRVFLMPAGSGCISIKKEVIF